MIPQETKETLEVILTNRVFLYKLFHKTFGREPDASFLSLLADPAVAQAFSILSAEGDDTMSKAAAFVVRQSEKADDAEYVHQLYNEYMRLFIGPQKLIAPPWESVYRSHQGLLFQESTLTIREIYRKQGFQTEGYPRVPEDSLSLELDFTGRMAERALAAFQADDAQALRDALAVSESFLRVHLLFWVPKLIERMTTSAFKLFYPQMTKALLAFMEIDHQLVCDILAMDL
ncbi:MAG: molecular chaperone TorD family protein [Clostridia bacterium]|nr:molecular chaperone TorD family protein [Clostridia bacterium]